MNPLLILAAIVTLLLVIHGMAAIMHAARQAGEPDNGVTYHIDGNHFTFRCSPLTAEIKYHGHLKQIDALDGMCRGESRSDPQIQVPQLPTTEN